MVRGHGSYDEATKTIAETGELHCPMRGGKMDYRSEVKFIDDNTYEYNMYGPDKDGQEFKMLELRYARK